MVVNQKACIYLYCVCIYCMLVPTDTISKARPKLIKYRKSYFLKLDLAREDTCHRSFSSVKTFIPKQTVPSIFNFRIFSNNTYYIFALCFVQYFNSILHSLKAHQQHTQYENILKEILNICFCSFYAATYCETAQL